MKSHALTRLNTSLKWICGAAILASVFAAKAVPWPNKPLATNLTATPMTMLLAGRDHKLFYEAYNDASDIGGALDGGPDGKLDVGFNPKITYFGLYDSALCYKYDETDKMHVPTMVAKANGVCRTDGANWSGNWLNYVTTSRIDALRKVLYGGYREIDTPTRTVLRRAYIPQDAHSWGKEYTSIAVDGYNIRDYSPFDLPAAGERIFFGSLTPNANTNCANLNDCSNIAPALRVYEKVTNRRIWEWASTERPVLDNSGFNSTAKRRTASDGNDFQVRVQVCTGAFLNDCKQYPNGSHKPVGLLHEYGENDSMLFGLMTGSYDNNMSGGRLRKIVSSFADEVDPQTGIFKHNMTPAGQAPIVQSFDNLRIRDFNNGNTSAQYRGGWDAASRTMNQGEYPDWGNPIGEVMYEATRYFAGKKLATPIFAGTATVDGQVGLPIASWDDPYKDNATKNVASCSRASFLTISDINPSFDSDQLPGSSFSTALSGDLSGLNVSTRADTITTVESGITGLRFIGQSGSVADAAPSAKTVNSLASVRGLAPEEPSRQGSYYAASVAHYAKTVDLRTDLKGAQTVDNFVVALSSPLPRIEVNMPGDKRITLVPFAKSVNEFGIGPGKDKYQPTNQIVDFYVEQIVNQTPNERPDINGGRYSATFGINFEDVEQGADHDMDVIARYVVQATSTGSITVTVTPDYQAGSIQQHLGYVISGTSADGVYLVARDEGSSPAYFLNVPAGKTPGYCNPVTGAMPGDCGNLPTIGQAANVFTFVPGSGTGATFLKDPLWYAAKWGGAQDRNDNGQPDLEAEWDSDKDGVPDTYFLVQNPLKLQAALRRAFDSIVSRKGGGGNVVANSRVLSTSTTTETLVFQGVFDTAKWSGNLIAYPATSATGVGLATWSAAKVMPLAADRKIFYSTASGTGALLPASSVPSDLSSHIASADLLQYLRGDSSRELARTGGIFRDRATTVTLDGGAPIDLGNVARLGDIAHSSPVYVKDTESVYVGANDGMLHAFNAKTGVEQFAFIPSAVLPRLKNLAGLGYNEQHEFFVDGDIAVSSRTQTSDKNYLVAALGRGGKGLFGLDVTNVGTPTGFSAGDIQWEYFDGASDPDLGYMLGRPIIARMNNGQWAVLVGNGYESNSGHAALYIFKLDDGTLLRKFTLSSAGTGNGMATPGTYDSDNDGRADIIYAGDLKGNVWKFDVSAISSSAWTVANLNQPIFVARDAAGKAQPITAPVTAAKNTVTGDANIGQVHVFFGTGSYFKATDPNDKSPQTWYSIIDRAAATTGTAVNLLRSNMVERNVLATGTFDGKAVRTFEKAGVGDTLNKDGCFTELPESGERMVTASNLFRLAEPTLIASSIIPIVDQCLPGGTGYVNAINPFTCGRLNKPFFDVNGNANFSDDVLGGNSIGSLGLNVGMPGEAIIVGNRLIVGGSEGTLESVRINSGAIRAKGRIAWREIIRD